MLSNTWVIQSMLKTNHNLTKTQIKSKSRQWLLHLAEPCLPWVLPATEVGWLCKIDNDRFTSKTQWAKRQIQKLIQETVFKQSICQALTIAGPTVQETSVHTMYYSFEKSHPHLSSQVCQTSVWDALTVSVRFKQCTSSITAFQVIQNTNSFK